MLPAADGVGNDAAGTKLVVLGVGGEHKNAFTLAEADLAFTSAHLRCIGSWESQRAFKTSVAQLTGIHRRAPEVLVPALHTDYARIAWAQRWAEERPDAQMFGVQHHWAHALSPLAEHGISEGPVVVASLDGTGYGLPESEGTGPFGPRAGASGIWGGEVLTMGGQPGVRERSWHVSWFPLVGGDRAASPLADGPGAGPGLGADVTVTPAWRRWWPRWWALAPG